MTARIRALFRVLAERRLEAVLLVAWVLAMVALPIVRAAGGDGPMRAGVVLTVALPAALVLVYGVTWFLETVGLIVFWGLPGPGALGGLAMGACLVAALWQHRRR